MAKKKKQQKQKEVNSANLNERTEKKEKIKAKDDKKIVVERPRVFQLDFKECVWFKYMEMPKLKGNDFRTMFFCLYDFLEFSNLGTNI